MDLKQRILLLSEDESWKHGSSVDRQVYLTLFRKLKKQYKPDQEILKDNVIKELKDMNLVEPSKFKRYVNEIYGNKTKLTLREFSSILSELSPKKSEEFEITRPDGSETEQVLDKVENIGGSAYEPLKKIILKYKDDISLKIIDLILTKLNAGHFKGTSNFLRYNKVSKDWIHISAVQTDFFGEVRYVSSQRKRSTKERKFFSEILSLENDLYRAIFSKLVNENQSVKIWTMSTSQLAKKIEHISNAEKLKNLYEKLPMLFGFRKKDLNYVDRVLSRKPDNAKKSFFLKIKAKTPGKEIWFATREMVNEDTLEDNLYISEMARVDVNASIRKHAENLEFIKAIDEYIDNIKKRAEDENKNIERILGVGEGALEELILKAFRKNKMGHPEEYIFSMFRDIYRKKIGMEVTSLLQKTDVFKFLKKFKLYDVMSYLKKAGLLFDEDDIEKEALSFVEKEKIPNTAVLLTYFSEYIIKEKDFDFLKRVIEKNIDRKPEIRSLLSMYLKKKEDIAVDRYIQVLELLEKSGNFLLTIAFKIPEHFTVSEVEKVIDKISSFSNKYPKSHLTQNLIGKRISKVLKAEKMSVNVLIKDPSAIKDITDDVFIGKAILRNSGVSEEEIEKTYGRAQRKTSKHENRMKKRMKVEDILNSMKMV